MFSRIPVKNILFRKRLCKVSNNSLKLIGKKKFYHIVKSVPFRKKYHMHGTLKTYGCKQHWLFQLFLLKTRLGGYVFAKVPLPPFQPFWTITAAEDIQHRVKLLSINVILHLTFVLQNVVWDNFKKETGLYHMPGHRS